MGQNYSFQGMAVWQNYDFVAVAFLQQHDQLIVCTPLGDPLGFYYSYVGPSCQGAC